MVLKCAQTLHAAPRRRPLAIAQLPSRSSRVTFQVSCDCVRRGERRACAGGSCVPGTRHGRCSQHETRAPQHGRARPGVTFVGSGRGTLQQGLCHPCYAPCSSSQAESRWCGALEGCARATRRSAVDQKEKSPTRGTSVVLRDYRDHVPLNKITIPPLSTLTSRATHAHPTSPRSSGFCAIWDCISSSSTKENESRAPTLPAGWRCFHYLVM